MIQKKNIVVTVFLLAIGIGFLAATTVRVINTHDFIARAKTADGVVIVTKHAKSHPRIEYTNAAGEKRWFLANEWIENEKPLVADIISDNVIDRYDLSEFCGQWLLQSE